MTLDELALNREGVIIKIDSSPLKERLNDLGLVPGTKVKCTLISPLKDPKAYLIKGTQIAIRNQDAKTVQIFCEAGDSNGR